MFSRLYATLSLALLCVATPVKVERSHISFGLARHFQYTGEYTIPEIDRARGRALQDRVTKPPTGFNASSVADVPVTNAATIYTVAVDVGSPPTTFNLIVDTGSSNTWVGADSANPYTATSSATATGEEFLIEYGSGIVLGEEYIDTITFGDITIPQQSLGGAEIAIGFSGVDGILGIGPVDLTDGTTSGGEEVPTVTDNAKSLGLIDTKQVGVFYEPSTSVGSTDGELSFGGPDPSKFNGTLTTVPITTTSPSNKYFGVDQTTRYGDTVILAQTAGIVDTGTTLILLATDGFQAYQAATGAVADSATGLLSITPAQYDALESLFFELDGVTLELTPNAQIWPRSLNTVIGGTADAIYLIVGDWGQESGQGWDFIDGYAFLQRYYSVFDTDANTVSFAETPFTFATTN